MAERDVLALEIGSALTILTLLLVFLPLFLQSASAAISGEEDAGRIEYLRKRTWVVPAVMAVTAFDATSGLLTMWGDKHWAGLTGWLLLILLWLLVALAVMAIIEGD